MFQSYFLGQCNASINRLQERAKRAEEHYRQLSADAAGADAGTNR
jgi:hypothetical protein